MGEVLVSPNSKSPKSGEADADPTGYITLDTFRFDPPRRIRATPPKYGSCTCGKHGMRQMIGSPARGVTKLRGHGAWWISALAPKLSDWESKSASCRLTKLHQATKTLVSGTKTAGPCSLDDVARPVGLNLGLIGEGTCVSTGFRQPWQQPCRDHKKVLAGPSSKNFLLFPLHVKVESLATDFANSDRRPQWQLQRLFQHCWTPLPSP